MGRFTVLITAVALSTWACGSNNVTPDPILDPITDTFSDELKPASARTHQFATPRSGLVQARLATLLPDSSIVVGLSLGTWNGAACNIVLANDKATVGSEVLGQTSGAGNLCVRVYDVGNLTEAVTYDLQVTHP